MRPTSMGRFILCLATLLLATCKDRPSAPSPPRAVIPSLAHVTFVYAVFFPKSPPADLLSPARAAITDQREKYVWAESEAVTNDGLFLADVSTEDFPPPSATALQYFGRGLDAQDADLLQQSKRALVLRFACRMQNDFNYVHSAELLAARIAADCGGVLWDESTRLMYSPAQFRNLVLDHWQDNLPSLRRDIAVHVYDDGDLMRAVSLGMEKYGLPNLAVNQISRSASDSAVTLITLCGQAWVEAWPAVPHEPVDVNLNDIRQPDVKSWVLPTLKEGASRHETVRLAAVPRQKGDAEGPLYELTFAGEKGASPQERQEAFLARLFGSQDHIIQTAHDDDLLELSRQAREKLQALKPAFLAGLKPGERLLVKGPFHAGNNTEWMWVEASRWEGDVITGTLQNTPQYVTSLRAGTRVSVDVTNSFDYLLVHTDGTTEGNQTGELMLRRQQR